MSARRPATLRLTRAGTPTARTSLALLMLVVAGITLPFIYKAFHLVATIFIRLAQHLLRDPLSPGLDDHVVYCCGSPAMVTAVRHTTIDAGLAATDFHGEVFVPGPAAGAPG